MLLTVPAPPTFSGAFEDSTGHDGRFNLAVNSHTVSHNLGAVFLPSSATGARNTSTLYAVGGQYRQREWSGKEGYRWDASHRMGIYCLEAPSLVDAIDRQWFPYNKTMHIEHPPIIKAGHPGCIEQRKGFGGVCEYDGKLSIVRFGSRFLLYTRANLKPEGGGRFVQVASSDGEGISGGFAPFVQISIDGYDPQGPGNIYFAAVKPYPYDSQLLLGLFSVNLGDKIAAVSVALDGAARGNTDGRAFIGAAISCDGVAWSRLFEVAPASGRHHGRAYDHPVDGLLVQGDEVSILIHRHVYEISPEAKEQSVLVEKRFSRRTLDKMVEAARPSLRGCKSGSSPRASK